MTDTDTLRRTRALNDALRRGAGPGKIFMTRGIAALGKVPMMALARAIAEFDDFSEANDPYGEHDFGSLDFDGAEVLWKIDYYDLDLSRGSPDPSDPAVTTRVMTIMLAEEW